MGRPPCCDKEGVKKGPWTPEEDIILVSYIQEHGPGNWRAVPTNTGINLSFFPFLLLGTYVYIHTRYTCTYIGCHQGIESSEDLQASNPLSDIFLII